MTVQFKICQLYLSYTGIIIVIVARVLIVIIVVAKIYFSYRSARLNNSTALSNIIMIF